jgi:hypothetical protein
MLNGLDDEVFGTDGKGVAATLLAVVLNGFDVDVFGTDGKGIEGLFVAFTLNGLDGAAFGTDGKGNVASLLAVVLNGLDVEVFGTDGNGPAVPAVEVALNGFPSGGGAAVAVLLAVGKSVAGGTPNPFGAVIFAAAALGDTPKGCFTERGAASAVALVFAFDVKCVLSVCEALADVLFALLFDIDP